MPGVYLSHPFCGQKCTYCNFASGVMPAELERTYLDALGDEIRRHDWKWDPETVYLGGGTPSRVDADALRCLLELVPGHPWREATIEVAPGNVSSEQAEGWAKAGINRVSLGAQSFAREEIARTGRKHTAELVEKEVGIFREAGITEINVDLIAGLAGQTLESWRASLDWIERLCVDHVSVYMLEVDEDSRLGRELIAGGKRYGAGDVPSEELTVDLYQDAVERLERTGILRYEISNFARPGHESRHNLKYWKLEPYVGFGADAHSFDGTMRRENVETAAEYVGRWRDGLSLSKAVSAARLDEEQFFVGLRLQEGIEPATDDWTRFDGPISRFLENGLLSRDGDRLRLTDRGVLLSNEVFREFLSS